MQRSVHINSHYGPVQWLATSARVPQAGASTSTCRRAVSALMLALCLVSTSVGAQTISATGDVSPSPGAHPWNLGIDSLYAGNSSTGTLTIADGASVLIGISQSYIGNLDGVEGTVIVTGAGSSLDSDGNMIVGNSGIGTLTIEAGGRVSNALGYMGLFPTSEGTVTVTGAGSSWENNDDLIVGNLAPATLTIAAGGSVSNARGYMGLSSSAEGTVTVTGAGSSWESDNLYVGNAGTGTLTIEAGASVHASWVYMGNVGGGAAEGTVTVTGAGSSLESDSYLIVGNMGTGTLNIGAYDLSDTAGSVITNEVSTASGSGTVNFNQTDDITFAIPISGNIALNQRGIGTTRLTGNNAYTGGTVVEAGTLQIGDGGTSGRLGSGGITNNANLVFNRSDELTVNNSIAGSGSLLQAGSGTTILTGANSYGGDTTISDGTLLVNGSIASAVIVQAGGILGGSGSVGQVVSDGTLAPGNSPGTLVIAGDLILSAISVLNFELDTPDVVGGGVNDLIEVDGNLTLDGTLNIIDWGNYGVGTYRLINFTGTITDNGLDIGTQPPGFDVVLDTTTPGEVNLIVSARAIHALPVFTLPGMGLLILLLAVSGLRRLRG